ncbi:hypothetical protein GGTG_06716 [Gaeumannomyces tritici R3-111a-1]|uniref:Uncharacterized protein n=1 Tax=Gaeumannomyces tritici (strain R3-111a-1) TaxID=644352 RepID=J3NZL9_GAET3|nr:hypothetical protein GGTG_06716 [Gaeumannomyces tritici R3-111a-1]EJT76802.1 hypothetical protein GGTG_06716 [Gaeumannomyces tritici R3-111a-1]
MGGNDSGCKHREVHLTAQHLDIGVKRDPHAHGPPLGPTHAAGEWELGGGVTQGTLWVAGLPTPAELDAVVPKPVPSPLIRHGVAEDDISGPGSGPTA